ncbi:DNA-binding protein P3A2-like isoform X2 [Dreissena polymorpha]|uniref:DNA-binding protein P3A2-like isoform X2 n=1 Tax=Dreissena polymorpha TaxID=45954 RepID=UPI002263F2B8|nr:DNA-binding protein P3A2-like isoform X2 [Dreissena polymorpha]
MNHSNSMDSGQMPSSEILSDLSEASSPDSVMYDTDIMGSSVSDDVTNQLAASGPVGVAAAAAVLSTRKRKHPHHFETNPARRKRQQTRLLRKLRHTIEEYSTRVGQQAVVLCCTPNVNQSMQIYKVFGSQPLEGVMRNNKPKILMDLDHALLEHTPPSQSETSSLHELPSLIMDGIPTQVDKMTQAQLRNFIPEMLKYSTGRSKPGWGRLDCRPVWWPSDLPWANVRSDVRTDEDKKRVFKDEHSGSVMVQHQQYTGGAMMQTINNPDGSVSIIQIDQGPNQIVTLPDGTQATVVHAIHDNSGLHHLTAEQEVQITQAYHTFAQQNSGLASIVTQGMDVGAQHASLGTLQAQINSSGQIILTGADASQFSGIMTVLPVSMYQAVQPITSSLPVNFQLAQSMGHQSVEIAMAPVSMAMGQQLHVDNSTDMTEEGSELTIKSDNSSQEEGDVDNVDTGDTDMQIME